ncbi:MAG: hypothetical protein KBS81_00780, partial [Spirochaetales bacterium]|nr:hypothetical protein [Candidatus Physcosoma equi]
PEATFYYTFGFDENFLLRAIKSFIPVPLLYMAPVFLATYGVAMLETYIIRLFQKKKKKA